MPDFKTIAFTIGCIFVHVTSAAHPQAASHFRNDPTQHTFHPRLINPALCHGKTKSECQRFDTEAIQSSRRLRKISRRVKKVRLLVILLRFKGHENKELPDPREIEEIFNGKKISPVIPTGSVSQWLNHTSYGQVNIEAEVVPWTLSDNTEEFYSFGKSGITHDFASSFFPVLNVLQGKNFDFSRFDMNNDGQIDATMVIHSGYSAELGGVDCDKKNDKQRIWSHAVPGVPRPRAWTSFDHRVFSGPYAVVSGLRGHCGNRSARIGVLTHELLHLLGVGDLNDSGSNFVGKGLGHYDVMSSAHGVKGDQTHPPHPSPWSKMRLGWSEPTEITKDGVYRIEPSAFKNQYFKIKANFPANEYLLIENRQAVLWDKRLAGSGILIYHVDDNTNMRNRGFPGQNGWPGNGNHYRVSLLSPRGNYGLERGEYMHSSKDFWTEGSPSLGPGLIEQSATAAGTYPNTNSYKYGLIQRTGISIGDFKFDDRTKAYTFRVSGISRAPASRGISNQRPIPSPTRRPTLRPTSRPTPQPTPRPTPFPTIPPTAAPTYLPTDAEISPTSPTIPLESEPSITLTPQTNLGYICGRNGAVSIVNAESKRTLYAERSDSPFSKIGAAKDKSASATQFGFFAVTCPSNMHRDAKAVPGYWCWLITNKANGRRFFAEKSRGLKSGFGAIHNAHKLLPEHMWKVEVMDSEFVRFVNAGSGRVMFAASDGNKGNKMGAIAPPKSRSRDPNQLWFLRCGSTSNRSPPPPPTPAPTNPPSVRPRSSSFTKDAVKRNLSCPHKGQGITITNVESGRLLYTASSNEKLNGVGASQTSAITPIFLWKFVPTECPDKIHPNAASSGRDDEKCWFMVNAANKRRLFTYTHIVGGFSNTNLDTEQMWKVQRQADNSVRIINVASGRVLYAKKGFQFSRSMGAMSSDAKESHDRSTLWRMECMRPASTLQSPTPAPSTESIPLHRKHTLPFDMCKRLFECGKDKIQVCEQVHGRRPETKCVRWRKNVEHRHRTLCGPCELYV